MTRKPYPDRGMTLFTHVGERKYLCESERKRFYAALDRLDEPKDRTFCEMIYWTGCRPSEALALCAVNIDMDERAVVIRSLKKRGEWKGRHFRSVPIPASFLQRLDAVHGLHSARTQLDGGHSKRLWTFSRTTAWKRMRLVMEAAGLDGEKACAKGLRHGLGVHAVMNQVPETRIKNWLGHASLATTEIYLQVAAPEDRLIAERMWAA